MADVLSYDHINEFKVGPLERGVDLDRFYSRAIYPVGQLAFGKDGTVYKFVRFRDAVTYAAGHVVTVASDDGNEVTNDRSGGSAIAGLPVAGVCLGAPNQDDYGWIQVAGVATVLAGTGLSAGDQLIPHASTNGAADARAADSGTAANNNVFGFALAGISNGQTGAAKLAGVL